MPAPNTNACFTRGLYADVLAAQTEVRPRAQAARFFRSHMTRNTIPATEAAAGSRYPPPPETASQTICLRIDSAGNVMGRRVTITVDGLTMVFS